MTLSQTDKLLEKIGRNKPTPIDKERERETKTENVIVLRTCLTVNCGAQTSKLGSP